jgi:hypothetical protein
MGWNPVTGMVMGAAAIGFVVISMATRTEMPPAGYALLDYGLLGLGAVGFIGSLAVYLKNRYRRDQATLRGRTSHAR